MSKRVTLGKECEDILKLIRRECQFNTDADAARHCIKYFFEKNQDKMTAVPLILEEQLKEISERVTFLEEQYEDLMNEKERSFSPEKQ